MPAGDRRAGRPRQGLAERTIKQSKAKPNPCALGKGAAAVLRKLFYGPRTADLCTDPINPTCHLSLPAKLALLSADKEKKTRMAMHPFQAFDGTFG